MPFPGGSCSFCGVMKGPEGTLVHYGLAGCSHWGWWGCGTGQRTGTQEGQETDPALGICDAVHCWWQSLCGVAVHISHAKETHQIVGLSLVKAPGCFLWCFLNYCFRFQKFSVGTRHCSKLVGNRRWVVCLGLSLSPMGENSTLPLTWTGISLALLKSKWALNFISFYVEQRRVSFSCLRYCGLCFSSCAPGSYSPPSLHPPHPRSGGGETDWGGSCSTHRWK